MNMDTYFDDASDDASDDAPEDALLPRPVVPDFRFSAETVRSLARPMVSAPGGTVHNKMWAMCRLLHVQAATKAKDKTMIDFCDYTNDLLDSVKAGINQMPGIEGFDASEEAAALSFSRMKRLVKEICLPNVRQIDLCPNGCVAFYNSPCDLQYQYAKKKK
jgi:hypothetical protein